MIFANTIRCHNIGDAASSPFNYWQWPASSVHIDTRDYQGGPAIIGGGGLLHPGIDEHVHCAAAYKPSVLWGAGSNYDPTKQLLHPLWLSQFDLVGLRDFGCGYRYVPCASCMHPAFDAIGPPSVEIAIYEHHDQPITLDDLPLDVPRMNNWADQMPVPPVCVGEAITFISRASLVVTNSYHGVYWAMLCGRKVLLWRPWSTKFCAFKYHPTVIIGSDWKSFVDKATTAPQGYLEECRSLNQSFHDDVVAMFGL